MTACCPLCRSDDGDRTYSGVHMSDPAAYDRSRREPYGGDWHAAAECGWRSDDGTFAEARDAWKAHTETAHPAELAAAREFYAHAEAHYNDGGWDVIVETKELGEIAETFASEGITTLKQALAKSVLMACIDVWADREADARNSAF